MAKAESKELTVPMLLTSGVGLRKIAEALPMKAEAEAERYARHVARAAITSWADPKNKLQECAPVSVLASVIQAAQLGLDPNNALGHAYLIPYAGQCTLQIGYKGMIALAHRSPDVLMFEAHEVWKGDEFDFSYGSEGFIRHRPLFQGEQTPDNRKGVDYFWAGVRLRGRVYKFEVMPSHEVWNIEKRYSKGKRDDRPWLTNPYEMGKKTVIRRLAKTTPMTVEMASAVAIDEASERGEPTGITLDIEPEEMTGGGAEGPISNVQIQELQSICADPAKAEALDNWLGGYGYGGMSDIPASQFEEAKEACK